MPYANIWKIRALPTWLVIMWMWKYKVLHPSWYDKPKPNLLEWYGLQTPIPILFDVAFWLCFIIETSLVYRIFMLFQE